MKISIVTVCYNSFSTIKDTIETVIGQSHPNIEYIVVDGGSNDGTINIVKQYADHISTIISEADKGIYDAMNKGIATASGDVIGILNSDDFFEDHQIVEVVANVFKAEPSLDVVFGDVVYVRPDDLHHIVRYYTARYFRPWMLRFGWMPPHPATFVRRKVYEQCGLYEPSYKIAADYEMFVRALLVKRLSFAWIDEVVVRMRTGGVSTGGITNSILLNVEIVRACKSNGIYTNLPLVLSKIPLKVMELIRRPKAKSSREPITRSRP